MPFSCQIHFRGLIAFAFAKASRTDPEAAHAFLTRSERGERYHRPLLTYYITDLDSEIIPVSPDPLQFAPGISTTAARELDNEILTLIPKFADSDAPGLSLNPGGPNKPAELAEAAKKAIHRTCFEFVPDLATADSRMVQPLPGNGLAGVRKECLETSISEHAPITARLDFDQGDLQANAKELDGRWTFRTIGDGSTSSSIDQPLAESAILVLRDLENLQLQSSHGPDLIFKSDSDPVHITLSNEEPRDFRGAIGRGDDYAQLYKIFEWKAGRIPSHNDRFVPHSLEVEATADSDVLRLATVREQLCGVATVLGNG